MRAAFALGALALTLAGCPASLSQVQPAAASPSPSASAAGEPERLEAAGVKALAEPYLLVDVRAASAYAEEHAEGAVNVPLAEIQAGRFEALPKDEILVLYCTCPTEASSMAAGRVLLAHGYTRLYALKGGLAGWEAAGGGFVKADAS